MKYLIFDAGNILYRTFYVHKSEDDITITGLAVNTAFMTINKYFKMFKPCKVVMAFDRSSWRKKYTASDECISEKPYKGNRRQNMTPSEEARYKLFLEHVGEFENMLREYTSIPVIADEGLEADDIIAGLCQTLSVTEPDADKIIISQDKDLIQLLRYNNVRLIDPATGHDRTLEDWDNDPDLFIFEKCIRGDAGDNVQSAYPRIRRTRILKAYDDDYEKTNIMEHEWELPLGNNQTKKVTVKDLFKENVLLMDLSAQPLDIQKRMVSAVLYGLRNTGKFDYFTFLRFIGKYQMKRLGESIEYYIPMLSS
jgi:5'-3' exonuclease